jgi:vanillate/4-hydroxybenzoate decarboxylase subunit D
MSNKSTLHPRSGELLSCPRCNSQKTEIVSASPVEGAWVIYSCSICFYSWRSSEPDYATSVEHYNPHFKIRLEEIDDFAEVPTIPPLRATQD